MPILTPGQFIRMLRINWVLMLHGLDDIIFTTHLFRPFRLIIYIFPWNWFRRKRKPRAVRMREALEDLGPIFIKFGQMLSTRRDLLADDIADELQRLQDDVPPFPGKEATKIVEKAFGQTVAELFATFDEQPLASASIAQVHAAVLKTGEDVVVKVLRPGVLPIIKRDLSLLYIIAELAARYSSQLRRLRPVEVIEEYEKTILDELDLLREAANGSQLRRNFEDSPDLYVPEIYWDYVRKDVIVMERIYGVSIRDMDVLREQGTDMERLAAMGVEIFFTQVFAHNFFHADMHPGNIFVNNENPKRPQYIAVDFGIIGTLSQTDKRYLAENFLAFFKRDYYKVAKLHVESGWVPSHTRIDEFESAIRSVCEPIFEKPLKEISFGQLLLRLFQTARRFNMEVQPQLVLLQKTLLNIEGLGRQLYPELDLWKTAKPFLENWMQEQIGPRALLRNIKEDMPYLLEKMPEMPGLLYKSLKASAEGEYHLKQIEELEKIRQELNQNSHRSAYITSGSATLVGASIIYALADSVPMMFGAPVLAWYAGAAGALLVIYGLKK